ncbi:urease accessory protein UreD, partial [Staphylococcus simiae CCM 7213 = CCUG 51256]
IYDAVKDYLTTYDCRLSISQLPTHGLAIRILAYRTQ